MKVSLFDLKLQYESMKISKLDYVMAVYKLLLCRDVDEIACKYWLEKDILQLADTIIASVEFKKMWGEEASQIGINKDLKDVLLFGAYGNGNLGDAIQAASLRRLVLSMRPDFRIWATSTMPWSYDFPGNRLLSRDYVEQQLKLNRFSGLIIGGGGLFSHPHDPLIDTTWQNSIRIPTFLLGVGASGNVASLSTELIQHATIVAGRDKQSLDALRQIRDDIEFAIDPVLADPFWENLRPHSPHYRKKRSRILWILKKNDLEKYKTILQHYDHNRDTICFIEPHQDFQIIQDFPSAIPIYDVEELISLIDTSNLVVTMRFHGAIFSILRGVPVYGIREVKIRYLFERYGIGEQYSEDGSTFDHNKNYLSADLNKVKDDRFNFFTILTKILRAIGGSK